MPIFRACDVRGKYPNELHEPLFETLGQLIAYRWGSQREVLVGADYRNGSASLKNALIAGLTRGGARVLDGGHLPTPVVYFGRRYLGVGLAVVVTASHNPPEYNGLKLLLPTGPASHADIEWLAQGLHSDLDSVPGGTIRAVDLRNPYGTHMIRAARQLLGGKRPSGSIVIDPGGGTWSRFAVELLRKAELPVEAIHDVPDSTFSFRASDCANPANLVTLAKRVKEIGAAIGLAWDGDGDRLAVIDNAGFPLSSDQVSILLLDRLLGEHRDQKVLIDIKMSTKVRQHIERLGAIPVLEKSAHCALERTMLEQSCLFGCEYSGHYFFHELGGADDGFYAALRVLALASGHKLHDLVRELPPLFVTPDIRVSSGFESFDRLQALVQKAFPEGTVTRLDGLKVDVPDGWVLVRRSVSEEKLSFRFEGTRPESLAALIRRTMESVPEVEAELQEAACRWLNHPREVATFS